MTAMSLCPSPWNDLIDGSVDGVVLEGDCLEFSSLTSGIELGCRVCLVIFIRDWTGMTICAPLPIDDGLLVAVTLDKTLLEVDSRRSIFCSSTNFLSGLTSKA